MMNSVVSIFIVSIWVFLFAHAQVRAQDSACEYCDGWLCTEGLHKDFFTTGRHDPTNWDAALWENTAEYGADNSDAQGVEELVVRAQSEYPWSNGEAVAFSVRYRPTDGLVAYQVGDVMLEFNYGVNKLFEYILPFAKADGNGNSVELTDMWLNGTQICDIIAEDTYVGVQIPLSDEDQRSGFTVTGNVKLIWNEDGHPQEIPGFHIFAMNTHEAPTLITLASFEASAGINSVTVAWETASESDNAGFNIHRAAGTWWFFDVLFAMEPETDEYEKINSEIVPAAGGESHGKVYSYVDESLMFWMTYYYKLESIDNSGESSFFGPVKATPGLIWFSK